MKNTFLSPLFSHSHVIKKFLHKVFDEHGVFCGYRYEYFIEYAQYKF